MNAPVLLLYLNAGITLVIAFAALQRRSVPGSSQLFFLMLAAAFWSLSYALELNGGSIFWTFLWKRIKYTGIVTIPVSLFFFSLCYRTQSKIAKPRYVLLLSIVPVLILLCLWTNEYHHLFYQNTESALIQAAFRFIPEYGPAFWIHSLYSNILLIFTFINLAWAYRALPGVFKTQSRIILVSFVIPWLINLLYITKILSFISIDPTPFAFSIIGIALSAMLFYLNLFQPIPIAENHIVNNLKDIVLILTPQNQIIKLNSAAENLIGCKTRDVLGQPLQAVEANIWGAVTSDDISSPGGYEIAIPKDGRQFYFQCQLSPLTNERGKQIAKVILLNDISRIKQIELQLKKLNEDLETRINERTRELAAANISLTQQINQKELLFAELNHRVKNNLNIIRSLISLQASKIEDPGTIHKLEDLKNRINSIGLIYEKLYSKNEISQIDLKKYLEELLSALGSSLSHEGAAFGIQTDLIEVKVAVDMVIPIGLVITELITNSSKFAFTGKEQNKVQVTVLQEQNRLVIRLKDNGRGYPEDILKNNIHSMGMSLVQLLAKQLNGTITFSNDRGACAELNIPLAG